MEEGSATTKPQGDASPPGPLEKTRRALEAKLEQVQADLRGIEEAERRAVREGAARPQYGKRVGDHTADALEHRRNMAAGQSLERLAEQVQHALLRLGQGTYGRCERCGQPIAQERLAALPWAVLCIACQRQQESRRR